MANIKVILMRRVKTDKGWQHYPAAYAANGRVKPLVSIVGGQEVEHPVGYYELRFYDGKKPVYESLKGLTPAAAEDRRKKKEAQLSVVKSAAKHDIQIVPLDPKRKLLADALKQFLADTIARGSVEAEEVYRLACNEFLAVIGRQYADEIVDADIAAYHAALQAQSKSKRTVSNRHSNVKAFLLYLGYNTKTKTFPKPPKFDKTMPEIYSDQELKALFEAVKTPRESLLFRFLLQTGAREREAMHVEWSDIDTQVNTIRLHSKPKWGFRMKDFEEREIPLVPDLSKRLLAYKQDHPGSSTLIFAKAGKPDGHMLRTLKQKARAGGLNCGQCHGCTKEQPSTVSRECDNWKLHRFRSTYATKLLRDGCDIKTVQILMGHGELESTMRYVRPAENEHTQAAIAKMRWF